MFNDETFTIEHFQFVTKLPDSVWNREKKEWNHQTFKSWESKIQKVLGLEARIVGLARFRHSGAQLLVSNEEPSISSSVRPIASLSRFETHF